MRVGLALPHFDFSLPGVTSMMTDGHKLGLLPVTTGFLIVRDKALFEGGVPTPACRPARRARTSA